MPRTAFQTTDIEVTNGTYQMPDRPVIIAGGKERFRVRVTPRGPVRGRSDDARARGACVDRGRGVNGASNLFKIEVDTLARMSPGSGSPRIRGWTRRTPWVTRSRRR